MQVSERDIQEVQWRWIEAPRFRRQAGDDQLPGPGLQVQDHADRAVRRAQGRRERVQGLRPTSQSRPTGCTPAWPAKRAHRHRAAFAVVDVDAPPGGLDQAEAVDLVASSQLPVASTDRQYWQLATNNWQLLTVTNNWQLSICLPYARHSPSPGIAWPTCG